MSTNNGSSFLTFTNYNNAHKRSYNKSSEVAEMGKQLATIDMGRKLRVGGGYCAPFLRSSWVSI